MTVEKIYVVFKTHFDIGFTELARELMKRWDTNMFPDVFRACESTQGNDEGHRYVWTMPAWPLESYLDRLSASREHVEKAKRLIRQKQIVWHALPFTSHTEFCGLEEYIRGMYFSRKLAEEFGTRPVSAKMTDVVGHTWMLPSLLNKAGVKFLHLGPNSACKLPEIPTLFFWEGPDGGRVLTFYNKAGGYGSSLLPPEGWRFPVWLALMQTNDNIGPQGPEVVDDILQKVEKGAPGTKTVIGSLDDFYYALSEYPLDDIPVVRGDLADTWIHGTGTYPDVVGKLRALRHTLEDTEKAMSLGMICGVYSKTDTHRFGDSIAKAYESSLLFGEHTWGLNTLPYFKQYDRYYKKEDMSKNGDIAKMEQSWDEHREYYWNAEAEEGKTRPEVLNGIAASVEISGPKLVIFNGLGWNRDAWVNVEAFKVQMEGKHQVDASTGEELQTAVLNGKLHIHVKELPALGYKTVLLIDGVSAMTGNKAGIVCDAAQGVLDNRWYRIEVNPANGTIRSLKDKSTGHEWVGNQDQLGFAQYQYDIYSDDDATKFLVDSTARYYDWQVNALVRKDYFDQKHLSFSPQGFTIQAVPGERSATLVIKTKLSGQSVEEFGNARGVVTRITIYEDQPFIDVQYDLKDKEKTFCLEAGHFVFPLNLDNFDVAINKMGSVINPATDIIEGTNHNLYCCENWVDVTDGEKGMTVIPFDTQLFSIGSHGILNCRRTYVKEAPVLFFNAFNNSYGCNFPQWMGGDYTFRYRLIPHRGDWRQGNVALLAFESVAPPLVGFSLGNRGTGSLPASLELIRELDGMELLCMKPAENGDGFLLRLREITGERHMVELTFAQALGSLARCDLLERVQDDIDVKANEVSFETQPFEIHSFLVKLK